jgi:hypothetical protein
LSVDAAQDRVTEELVTFDVVGVPGAVGGDVSLHADVVALAMDEYAERLPAASAARTR